MAVRVTRRTVHVTFERGDIWLVTERHQLADGLTIRLRDRSGARGRPPAFSNAGDFLIERLESFPFDVATGLVAAWLYDVLRRNRATVTMDGDSLPVNDKRKLRRFLREHILRKRAATPRGPSKQRARPKARPVRRKRKEPKR